LPPASAWWADEAVDDGVEHFVDSVVGAEFAGFVVVAVTVGVCFFPFAAVVVAVGDGPDDFFIA